MALPKSSPARGAGQARKDELTKGQRNWDSHHAAMITRFHIENFKSLADFDLPPKGHESKAFACLIGLNGAGKSSLLQALDFVAQLATGDVSGWLERRSGRRESCPAISG